MNRVSEVTTSSVPGAVGGRPDSPIPPPGALAICQTPVKSDGTSRHLPLPVAQPHTHPGPGNPRPVSPLSKEVSLEDTHTRTVLTLRSREAALPPPRSGTPVTSGYPVSTAEESVSFNLPGEREHSWFARVFIDRSCHPWSPDKVS